MQKQISTWSVRLLAFGAIAALTANALADKAPPSSLAPVAGSSVLLQGPTDAQRIKSLEARETAHNTRIAHLEVSLALLQAQVANLPKPPPSTKPFCASESVQRNPQGGEHDCKPYRCNHATGSCNPSTCFNVDDCVHPYVCNDQGKCDIFHP